MDAIEIDAVVETSNEHLEAEVCSLAAQLAAATCRWLLMIGELDRREAYKEWGCASMAQWLSWKCGLSIVTGREHVRVAFALHRLPVIRERFASGVLTFSKVRAITRVATPATEASLVEFAEIATAAQLDCTVRAFERICVDRETAHAHVAARSVIVHHDSDGMVTIVARLPRDAGETVLAALEQAQKEVASDPDDASAEAHRADAVVHVAEAFLAGTESRPPTEAVVHVEAEQLSDPDRSPVLERLTCDTAVRIVTANNDGSVVARRRTRTIPRWLRRRLAQRDQGCRFPACSHERFFHVHHIVHFAVGGPTDGANCITLCSFHHRLVHEGGWQIIGASAEARELAFCSPTGRVIHEHDAPRRPVATPLAKQSGIDEHTVDTADGGRLDLGLAVVSFMSTLRPDLN